MPETAFDMLVGQRRQFLAFVRRRVADLDLAEDIVQTAYLRAVEHRDDFEPDESVVAWFYRLLRNAVIDSYRRRAAKNRALEAWKREMETETQPSFELHSEVCACLAGTLDGLRAEYSEILRSVDLGDERLQRFAEQHSISASNAGVRLHRARVALRKQLMQICSACAEHGCLDCTCRRPRPLAR